MFFDLNVVLPTPASLNKKKQDVLFSPSQVAAIEARIDILVHLGYTVIALTQTVNNKIDSRTHVNWFTALLPILKSRPRIRILKRLSLVLSDDPPSLSPQTAPVLSHYDILAIHPTSPTSFSHACLTTSIPSPHTAHIIALPLTLPRLPFHLKHTLVRTALKNGAVFEIAYSGAVGPESDRRSWWGAAREVVRVTKGKGILLSGGTVDDAQLRAPRDAANLITLLGIPQNLSHTAITQTPKTTVLRAQSRHTYRAVLSAPKLIIPSPHASDTEQEHPSQSQAGDAEEQTQQQPPHAGHADGEGAHRTPDSGSSEQRVNSTADATAGQVVLQGQAQRKEKKRRREEREGEGEETVQSQQRQGQQQGQQQRKKKRKK